MYLYKVPFQLSLFFLTVDVGPSLQELDVVDVRHLEPGPGDIDLGVAAATLGRAVQVDGLKTRRES